MADQGRTDRLLRSLRLRPTVPSPARPAPEPVAVDTVPRTAASCIVDAGIYVAGRRIATPGTFEEAFRLLDEHPEGFAWMGLYRPRHSDMSLLAEEFRLSPLAVEDTITAHQRPKFERYEDVLFLVLRAAQYIDRSETVDFGEVHAFVGDRFVVTVRHSETPDLTRVRQELEGTPSVLAKGPSVVLLRLLDGIVDDYTPVAMGIENDIDEIETQVFTGSSRVSRRIYQLSREVIDFQRAVRPLKQIIEGVRGDRVFASAGERRRQELRDIEDHAIAMIERIDALRETLKGTLDLNISLQAQRQNEEISNMTAASLKQAEETRRIAAWAGVLFVPSLVTGTYGMNFHTMPELAWVWGYPFALALMLVTGVGMYTVFKLKGWL
ncbi:magnesium and cobalt transport protein CorA [Tessaracoccus sp. MC1679]|uniref:magnesium and cobalt transport protein CorA n=1 Tax=unclassified Tessaracoccus TaxID=2635419 RepID=UPI00160185E4|nr:MULTISPECIES: magnesium and cobalt transport protein CorA [unclassified Tessaracoccus]MBB1513989.1 magnesium and cobalt transport protein CorA [Tessaracoccus sp. MC1627]MBB1516148.1 magnesium and cobalt transport protein CorA [Tessaracoccus sp. MC1679]